MKPAKPWTLDSRVWWSGVGCFYWPLDHWALGPWISANGLVYCFLNDRRIFISPLCHVPREVVLIIFIVFHFIIYHKFTINTETILLQSLVWLMNSVMTCKKIQIGNTMTIWRRLPADHSDECLCSATAWMRMKDSICWIPTSLVMPWWQLLLLIRVR